MASASSAAGAASDDGGEKYITVEFEDGPDRGLLTAVSEDDMCDDKYWRFHDAHGKAPAAKVLFVDGGSLFIAEWPSDDRGKLVDEDGDVHSYRLKDADDASPAEQAPLDVCSEQPVSAKTAQDKPSTLDSMYIAFSKEYREEEDEDWVPEPRAKKPKVVKTAASVRLPKRPATRTTAKNAASGGGGPTPGAAAVPMAPQASGPPTAWPKKFQEEMEEPVAAAAGAEAERGPAEVAPEDGGSSSAARLKPEPVPDVLTPAAGNADQTAEEPAPTADRLFPEAEASVINGNDLANARPHAALYIERAKSSRSKCKTCWEPISQGDVRCGFDKVSKGVTIQTWAHAACFIKGLTVEVCRQGRGKCKGSMKPFAKGDVRLAFVIGEDKTWWLPAAAARWTHKVLAETAGALNLESLKGGEELALEHREAVLNVLRSGAVEDEGALRAMLAQGGSSSSSAPKAGAKKRTPKPKAKAQDDQAATPRQGAPRPPSQGTAAVACDPPQEVTAPAAAAVAGAACAAAVPGQHSAAEVAAAVANADVFDLEDDEDAASDDSDVVVES
eukprot:TRINITY_DN28550_c0_g1_i2.p1 TRINITY_DN28550_c0_g1~~TRINITY_DN28550_c0_g1_i2.p1  ORF type:complete len:558 (+),score=185.57 TRINITY_DN28550_c0_g1_i2:99-1772(+)